MPNKIVTILRYAKKILSILIVIILSVIMIQGLCNDYLEESFGQVEFSQENNRIKINLNKCMRKVAVKINNKDLEIYKDTNVLYFEIPNENSNCDIELFTVNDINNIKKGNKNHYRCYCAQVIKEKENELVNSLFQEIGIKKVYLGNMNISQKIEFYNMVKKLIKEYPETKDCISSIIFCDVSQIECSEGNIVVGNAKIIYSSDGLHVAISLNRDYDMRNNQDYEKMLRTMQHEFAHVINYSWAIKRAGLEVGSFDYKINSISNSFKIIANEMYNKINYKYQLNDTIIKNEVSDYASTDRYEFFAETFVISKYYFEDKKIVNVYNEVFNNERNSILQKR